MCQETILHSAPNTMNKTLQKLLRLISLMYTSLLDLFLIVTFWHAFYRAMHFSAKRGIAIACRLSVCPSVRL